MSNSYHLFKPQTSNQIQKQNYKFVLDFPSIFDFLIVNYFTPRYYWKRNSWSRQLCNHDGLWPTIAGGDLNIYILLALFSYGSLNYY